MIVMVVPSVYRNSLPLAAALAVSEDDARKEEYNMALFSSERNEPCRTRQVISIFRLEMSFVVPLLIQKLK